MGKNKERKIPEILIFTDANTLNGDVGAFVVLAYLADRKLINIKGVLTERGTYEIRRRRGMYAKGALAYLGYPFVRVVPGGDYNKESDEKENVYIQNELTPIFESAGMTVLRSGTIFLQEYMKNVKEKNVFLFFDAPFVDFAKYLKATHDTILKKVKKVIIAGDVNAQKDENGFYSPDLNHANFQSSPEAAKILLDYLQEKDLRTTIVPTSVTEGMDFDFSFLDLLEKSKNPVTKQLRLTKEDKSAAKNCYYKMLAALAVSDGMFKGGGGLIEKNEGDEKNISFAKLIDPALMKEKLIEIFKEKLEPQKISFKNLTRPKDQSEE